MSEKQMVDYDGTLTPAGLEEAPLQDVLFNKAHFFKAVTANSVRTVAAFLDKHPDCVNWTMEGDQAPYKSYRGGTALHGVGMWDTDNIGAMLLKAGADPNKPDKDGNTPLLHAYAQGNIDACRLLVKAGARPDIENKEGESVLKEMEGKKGGEITTMIREMWQVKYDKYGRTESITDPPEAKQAVEEVAAKNEGLKTKPEVHIDLSRQRRGPVTI